MKPNAGYAVIPICPEGGHHTRTCSSRHPGTHRPPAGPRSRGDAPSWPASPEFPAATSPATPRRHARSAAGRSGGEPARCPPPDAGSERSGHRPPPPVGRGAGQRDPGQRAGEGRTFHRRGAPLAGALAAAAGRQQQAQQRDETKRESAHGPSGRHAYYISGGTMRACKDFARVPRPDRMGLQTGVHPLSLRSPNGRNNVQLRVTSRCLVRSSRPGLIRDRYSPSPQEELQAAGYRVAGRTRPHRYRDL